MSDGLDLDALIARLQRDDASSDDWRAFRSAYVTGLIDVTATHNGVAIGRDVIGSVVNTGSITITGPGTEAIQHAIRRELDAIQGDHSTRALRDYFRALREYCTHFPYVALDQFRGDHAPRSLEAVYVPPLLGSRDRRPDRDKPPSERDEARPEQDVALTIPQV